jgi:superfamily II DNA or RNA helicase
MEGLIKWFKKKIDEGKTNLRYKWLAACLERNKQLSRFKEEYTIRILDALEMKRTLTFCCDIEQSNKLGYYSIDSKNKKAHDALRDFNKGEIDHITCCSMLNEGVNLINVNMVFLIF